MRRLSMLILGLALLALPPAAEGVTGQTTRFVAGFEGFYSCVYTDPAGHATIGYGHLLHYGPPTAADRRRWGCISKQRALRLLRRDLKKAEDELFKRVSRAAVSPPMVTALTSFTFNLGPGYLDLQPRRGSRPATHVARRINAGRQRLAAREMAYFDGIIVNGRRYVVAGLTKRRRQERQLMLRGIRQLEACPGRCVTTADPANPADPGDSGGIGPGGTGP